MITLTFPDGAKREFDASVTGAALAASISKSLARKAVAMKLDGVLKDLVDPIETDSQIEIVTRDDPDALELIRHDAAHVMAEAVQGLFPGTQVTIGPVIEDGFYYDFAFERPFTTEDLEAIEAKMKEIARADLPVGRRTMARDDAVRFFHDMGERYKAEIIAAIPADEPIGLYREGEFVDLCRGPLALERYQASARNNQRTHPGDQLLQRRYSPRGDNVELVIELFRPRPIDRDVVQLEMTNDISQPRRTTLHRLDQVHIKIGSEDRHHHTGEAGSRTDICQSRTLGDEPLHGCRVQQMARPEPR